jgi:hypothetical protein
MEFANVLQDLEEKAVMKRLVLMLVVIMEFAKMDSVNVNLDLKEKIVQKVFARIIVQIMEIA